MRNKISLQFLGACGTVTGSKYLLRADGKEILVDCGLFQGLKKLRLLNWDTLPINPASIDVVLLTHGHLDHTGYLPRLVKDGFKGKIFGTAPTLEIAKIILEDSAKIQEEDAQHANEQGYTKHKPAKPLYNISDVKKTLPLFVSQQLDSWISLSENVRCRFNYNGHILGATFIELQVFDKLFVFSGDIGRNDDTLLFPPERPNKADILLIESTYGNRLHIEHPEESLCKLINIAIRRGGPIIIPGFAVERIQMLMYLIWKLKKESRIGDIPVYMDSPMGKNVLNVFNSTKGWHKLPDQECEQMIEATIVTQSQEDTDKVIQDKRPRIIIAGSGMGTGGRVLRYFQEFLSDGTATILLAGYQAEGTRGRQLLDHASEIKLYGQYYPVKAKIENIEGLSSHADQKGLIDWMGKIQKKPERIFIVHGEPQAADALRVKIKDIYRWDSYLPTQNEILEIY